MKQVEIEKLKSFVQTLRGETLRTIDQEKAFTVEVTRRGFEYTPASSGKPRTNDYRTIERVIGHFHHIQRYEPGQYHDMTRNASYLMAIIKRYFDRHEVG